MVFPQNVFVPKLVLGLLLTSQLVQLTCSAASKSSDDTKYEVDKLLSQLIAKLDDRYKVQDKALEENVESNRLTDVRATDKELDIRQVAVDPCTSGQAALLTASGGVIQSPGFSSWVYPSNARCRWTILAPVGMIIKLTFISFQLESAPGCSYDSLSLFNGPTNAYPAIGKYCGIQRPLPVTSSGPSIFIEFSSDAVGNDGGFSISWTFVGTAPSAVVPGGTTPPPSAPDPCRAGTLVEIRGLAGSIQLPLSGTGNYANNAACRWRIVVPSSKLVQVTFRRLGIEQSPDCQYDRVSVFDGPDNGSTLIGTYCGTLLPQELIQSTGSVLFVYFVSDIEDGGQGFVLNWNATDPGAGFVPTNANCGNPAIQPVVSLSRIVGGSVAVKNSWPWQCSIQFQYMHDEWTQWCGASVLNSRYLLTAAHCVFDEVHQRLLESDFKVICGEHDQKVLKDSARQISQVARIIVHEQYLPQFNDYDIAVFQLTNELSLNKFVQPICLPRDSVAAATKCVVTGWGDSKGTGDSTVLLQVAVPIVTQTQCSQRAYYGSKITDNMICAGYTDGGKDACQGDSGGPFVCKVNNRWFQHGVVSFGIGCAQPQKPGVYTRVTRFLQWIQDKTGARP
jgi:hypothetical protein